MILNWTITKLKYLKQFKTVQDRLGSVNAEELSKAIGTSGTAAHNFLNYGMRQGIIIKEADAAYKITPSGNAILEEQE
jgi:Mn-dependent DtxR family transcriptional regulator